jgi:hypothetical protein
MARGSRTFREKEGMFIYALTVHYLIYDIMNAFYNTVMCWVVTKELVSGDTKSTVEVG